ncbi:MAG TPA: ABC transporter substrate-binding protein [Candidatus Kapabacteria bacterium]|nr:ABC transporter substrate-binding protein [Candidatus Kapabacteria bacterium]
MTIVRTATALRSLIVLASLLLPILTGCGGNQEIEQSNTFRYNEAEDLNSLDPARISARASWWAGGQVHAGLVGLDPALKPMPLLARNWSTSSDGRVWTFTLRSDARFADDPCFPDGKGRRIVAEDVRYSFERICNPATASTGFWVFHGKVAGADEFFKDPAKTGHVAGFRALNDSTFELTLAEPSPLVLSLLAMPYCYVVPHEGVQKYGSDFFRHPVGAGAFKVAEWVNGQRLVLVRNGNYFERDAQGKQLPYLDSVVVSFIRDKKTEFAEFESGRLDMAGSIDATMLDKVFTRKGDSVTLTPEFASCTMYRSPSMSVNYYGFQLDPSAPGAAGSPFVTNPMLRRALNYAIDREALVHYVMRDQAIPASAGPVPPGVPGYAGVKGYDFDRDLALRLLDSAGYPNGKGLPVIVLQVSEVERVVAVAQAVQEQFKAIGITVKINQVSPAQHRQMVAEGKLPFWSANWMADYPDAENFIALFYSRYKAPSGSNTTRFADARVDSLYLAALAPGLGTEQRAAIYGQAEAIILREAPWLLLFHTTVTRLTRPGVKGYSVDPLDRLTLAVVRKS